MLLRTSHRFTPNWKIIFYLLLQQIAYSYFCNGLLMKCPLYQMHLQKIVGFRPPLEYINHNNLLYTPNEHYNSNQFVLQHINNDDANDSTIASTDIASNICWQICNEDDDCVAYVILLDTNECYGYSYFDKNARYQRVENDLPLVADANAIFFEKTCLKVPETCKKRLWTLTKIPGNTLIFQGKKTITTLVTRRECAELCLFETDFQCLSASFAPSNRNIRERFREFISNSNTATTNQQNIALGSCILSDKDKMIQPDAFRAAPYDEEYIENQCYDREHENENCSYELYGNSSFIYAEVKYTGLSQKECQAYCTKETRFYCQGVSFYYENNDLTQSECLLHSEDIISMGPRSLKLRENSIYMRRVKCLDVQVVCTHNKMSIKYKPKDSFSGQMYVKNYKHVNDCLTIGNGNESTELNLNIGNETIENHCGILRAYEVTENYQRTFISALIVMQNNLNVQTQGDRLIKVGCIMSHGINLEKLPTNNNNENVPNAIALESSLDFSQNTLSSEGTSYYNFTNSNITTKMSLQILDSSHNHETNNAQIGQNLELQIIAEYKSTDKKQINAMPLNLLNFRATSLAAKTLDDKNFILLIDENGCPTDENVFPAFKRQRTAMKNVLYANFLAFRFAGTDSLVNFDVKIEFCSLKNCSDENCIADVKKNNTNNVVSKRSKRQLVEQQKLQNPIYISTVADVDNTTQLHEDANIMNDSSVPLNYNLHVRGPNKMNSNSLIYSERGVLLIAGIDDQLHLDNICLNQSLLFALLIFWLIFQVGLMFSCCFIIQKYKRLANLEEERRKIHESFDYIDGRRVHWADQGGYTL